MLFVCSSYWIHEASSEKSSQMISKKNFPAPNLSAWTKKGKIKWPTSLTCSINLSETPRIEKLYLTSCLIVISLKQSFNDNKTWRRKSEMLNQMSSWWSRVSSSWSSYVRLSVYPIVQKNTDPKRPDWPDRPDRPDCSFQQWFSW